MKYFQCAVNEFTETFPAPRQSEQEAANTNRAMRAATNMVDDIAEGGLEQLLRSQQLRQHEPPRNPHGCWMCCRSNC